MPQYLRYLFKVEVQAHAMLWTSINRLLAQVDLLGVKEHLSQTNPICC